MPTIFESYEYIKHSVERTSRWAERGLKAHANPDGKGSSVLFKVLDMRISGVSQLMIC